MRLWRILRVLLIGPQLDNSWTLFAAAATFFISGAILRAMLPELIAIPVLGAFAFARLIGWVTHRIEYPVERRPVRYNDRRCTVEILSDPPPPPRR